MPLVDESRKGVSAAAGTLATVNLLQAAFARESSLGESLLTGSARCGLMGAWR